MQQSEYFSLLTIKTSNTELFTSGWLYNHTRIEMVFVFILEEKLHETQQQEE